MGSSLYAGISGLTASAKQMDVIGNNIANVNTIGFRAGKIQFADILSQSITGGSSTFMQVGRGVAISDVSTQFSPGSFETTANATDLSIDGDGFFIVEDADGGLYYTRAGAFHVDSDGNLVDINGYTVQGYNLLSGDPNTVTDISLSDVQSSPVATTTISIGANLDSATATGDVFNAAQTVYDSQG
jgi:flagellar hook protein FlgE